MESKKKEEIWRKCVLFNEKGGRKEGNGNCMNTV